MWWVAPDRFVRRDWWMFLFGYRESDADAVLWCSALAIEHSEYP